METRFFKCLIFTFLSMVLLACLNIACRRVPETKLEWPEISRETRPWTRWWWMGSSVDKAGITAAMQKYKDAGLGGLEITPIYGVKGHENRFIPYLSSGWMGMLDHTLAEAQRLEMGIDMATGTGWPFGGPWVSEEDASRYVTHQIYHLKEGENLEKPVVYIQESFVRAVNKQIGMVQLRQPVSANDDMQALGIEQVRFEKPLPLQALMAYSESGETLDLTGKVDEDGRLSWTAPAGNWTLYALFEGWHGKMVERAAPGGEGLVIDHFSGKAIKNYLQPFDSAFAGHELSPLRAFFNDSYEVDDARGEASWTSSLFEEFRERRGYDLREQLPALLGEDTPEKNSRVLSDYRETISDLLLEKFTAGWDSWAEGRGTLIRNQAHGSPANILDLYAASDIPETEGNDIMRFKFASSAGNVTGKKLVSCEAATWLNEHFSSSLSDVKQALDKFMLGGVNHIFYHGTNYSPEEETWPGWLFYAAVHFSPSNPFWKDFSALNHYVARCQSFLQQGKPDNDILLYFPVYDRFSEPSESMLVHFDGMEGWEGSDFEKVAQEMQQQGYAFDLISDRQLGELESADGLLQTGGNSYQVVMLPASRFIPLETFDRLAALARNGATVIAHKQLPAAVPGLNRVEERSKQYRDLTALIDFKDAGVQGVREAKIGKGRFLTGEDLEELLAYANVPREAMTDKGLQFVRRSYENGSYYFLLNSSDKPVDGWVPVHTADESAAVFNPMNKQYGLAGLRRNGEGQTEVYLQLSPGESCILQTCKGKLTGPAYDYYRPAGEGIELNGTWKIDFVSGGPELPPGREIKQLGSWTALEGEEVKRFSGTATYSIRFPHPGRDHKAWVLDLGQVYHSAGITLNGKTLDTLIGPEYRVLIDSALLSADNLLEISVSNLMGNRIAWMDRQGMPWKKFYNVNFPARLEENRDENGLFDASHWKPLGSGLAGPVTLRPVELVKPE